MAGRADPTLDAEERAAIAPARAFHIVAFLRTTRGMVIAGGTAVLVILLLVLALKGGNHSKKAPTAAKKTDKTSVTTPGKTGVPPVETGGEGGSDTQHAHANANGAGEATGETGSDATAETGSDATDVATGEQGSAATTGGTKTGGTKTGGAKTGPTIGGKQVVLEYDNQARDATSVPNNAAKSDQSAISKARTSYAAGNQRLFAGDADGAIRYYKQALGYYPAYVAGYRGLGLAYAQQGNKPAAVQAFRTYVSSVPSAKDAALIKKRIATLQTK
jgi:tetratricopeptide (TPR) repeat protein